MNLTDITNKRNSEVLNLKVDNKNSNYKRANNDATSIFIKQINKKLSLVNLTLSDFKKGKVYDFNEATVEKLIELYDFSLGQNINKFKKDQIKLVDKEIMTNYLSLLRELVESHFRDDEITPIIKNIDALEIDINIYEKESLNNIADDLFNKSGNVSKLQEVEKLFTNIYSVKQLELRLQPIKLQLQSLKVHTIDEATIQEVMTNFQKAFKKAMTQEQQKHLVTLIIKDITLNEQREIDSIQIQFNNTVLDYLTEHGADRSLANDLSAPFLLTVKI